MWVSWKICTPGYISSARIAIDIAAPMVPAMIANTSYIVPMSLWLVENSQRRNPVGWSWAWSSCASCVATFVAIFQILALKSLSDLSGGPHRPLFLPGAARFPRRIRRRRVGVGLGGRELLLRVLDPG